MPIDPIMTDFKSARYLLRDTGMLLLIAVISCCLGEVLRARQHSVAALSKRPDARADLSLEAFRAFVKSKAGLVLDGRSKGAYSSGHVPGALSFPSEYFEGAYLLFKGQLEANRNQAIAVYCSESECDSSRLIQRMLTALGFGNVTVFSGGWREWQAAGLPEERSQ